MDIMLNMLYTRLNFEVFKTEKTALKNLLIEKKYGQSENEKFEAFERMIILLFFEKRFPIDG